MGSHSSFKRSKIKRKIVSDSEDDDVPHNLVEIDSDDGRDNRQGNNFKYIHNTHNIINIYFITNVFRTRG